MESVWVEVIEEEQLQFALRTLTEDSSKEDNQIILMMEAAHVWDLNGVFA